MANDAARGEVVLFGGNTDNETWIWDGSSWTARSPVTSPPQRVNTAMAYDAARGQVVLFGGRGSDSSFLNDTWAWDGTTWTQMTPASSPPPLAFHAMAYDATRGQVVLLGGYDGRYYNETWLWDGTTWTQQFPANSPPARIIHAMAFDAAHSQVVLFGGVDNNAFFGDTWLWDGINWTQAISVSSPTPRGYPVMVYDEVGQQMVLFGGNDGPSYLADTWVWDGTNWSATTPLTAPSPREYTAVAYDSVHRRAVLFGGASETGILRGDTWVWPGVNPVALPVSIAPNGTVTFVCPAGYTNIAVEMYRGVYPDTSTQVSGVTGPSVVCALVGLGGSTMERGYLNESRTTDDGDYWVRISKNGVQYSYSDFSGEWYYWTARRAGGIWSNTDPTAAPIVTRLTPQSVVIGSPGFILTVTGAGFVSGATVRVDGATRPTTFLSATQVTAAMPASDVVSGGTRAITVVSPTAIGGGRSLGVPLSVVFEGQTPLRLAVAIAPAGAVTFTCPAGYTNIGWEMYKGTYPDTSTPVTQNTLGPTLLCSAVGAAGYTMERGYLNETRTTDDGDYWVRISKDGVQYSYSDFSGEWYYWTANRAAGVWSEHTLQPPPFSANNDAYTVIAGEPLDLAAPGVLANDANVPTLAWVEFVTSPTHGRLTNSGAGGFRYISSPTFTGTVSFTYVVRGLGVSSNSEATVRIRVIPPLSIAPQLSVVAGDGLVDVLVTRTAGGTAPTLLTLTRADTQELVAQSETTAQAPSHVLFDSLRNDTVYLVTAMDRMTLAQSTVSVMPSRTVSLPKVPPPYPVLLLHGFNSDPDAWAHLCSFMQKSLRWTFGGTIFHYPGSLTPQLDTHRSYSESCVVDDDPSHADFFVAEFDNNLGSLDHQGAEVDSFVSYLQAAGRQRLSLVAHSNGGLAARRFLASASPRVTMVKQLVTYGTPHAGADVEYVAELLSKVATATSAIDYVRLGIDVVSVIDLPSLTATLNEFVAGFGFSAQRVGLQPSATLSDIVRAYANTPQALDARFSCVPGQSSSFLESLPNALPLSLSEFVAISGANLWLNRRADCLAASWDMLVPTLSAEPTRPSPTRTLRTDRNHVQQTQDVASLLCAVQGVSCLEVRVFSPVDIEISDPAGRVLSAAFVGIPNAARYQLTAEDGHEFTTFRIPFALPGAYHVRVTPKPDAQPGDTYSITTVLGGNEQVLASNVPVAAAPSSPLTIPVDPPPVARAGRSRAVEATSPAGAVVYLDGTQSENAWGDALEFSWTGPFGETRGSQPTVTLPVGRSVVTLTVTNSRGSSASDSIEIAVVDTTAPSLSLPASVTREATGPFGAVVAFTVSALDLVDGDTPVACSPASGTSFGLGTTAVHCSSVDSSGNTVSGSFTVAVRDSTPPAISVNSPLERTYLLNQSVASSYTCTDNASGVQNCIGSVPNGGHVNTASLGLQSFVVTASDFAGNSNSVTKSYSVSYAGGGTCLGAPGHQILQPINADGTSVFKRGSSVPVKFRVCDGTGESIGTPGVVTDFRLVRTVAGTASLAVNEPVDSTTPDATFRWSATDRQWIFNISTKALSANVTYVYLVTLNDGSTMQFQFGTK